VPEYDLEQEHMTTRQANLAKQPRNCLKCGKTMLTDRCHRICAKCAHTNEGLLEERAAMTQDLRQWLRGFIRNDSLWDPLGSRPMALAVAED